MKLNQTPNLEGHQRMKVMTLIVAALVVMAVAESCQQSSERVKSVFAPGGRLIEEWTEARSEDNRWQREGAYIAYYPSGREKESGKYLHDQRDGLWSFWYDSDGHPPLMRGTYTAGEMDGVWEYWMDPSHHSAMSQAMNDSNSQRSDDDMNDTLDASGEDTIQQAHQMKPHKRESYKSGKPHGLWLSWHSETQIADSAFYINGKLEGRVVSYSPSGALWSEANYHAGALIGKVKIWNDVGERVK